MRPHHYFVLILVNLCLGVALEPEITLQSDIRLFTNWLDARKAVMKIENPDPAPTPGKLGAFTFENKTPKPPSIPQSRTMSLSAQVLAVTAALRRNQSNTTEPAAQFQAEHAAAEAEVRAPESEAARVTEPQGGNTTGAEMEESPELYDREE